MELFRLSIKNRLILLAALLLAAGTATRELLNLPEAQGKVRDVVSAQQTALARYLASDIDNRLRARQQLLTQLAAAVPAEVAHDPSRLTAWVAERTPLIPLFDRGLFVLRPNGCSTRRAACASGHAHAWVDAALASRTPVFGKPQRDPDNAPVLIAALALRDAAQRPVAVIAGITSLQPHGLLDGLDVARLGDSSGFLLISPSDRLFLGGTEPDLVMRPTPPAGVNALHDRAMAGYRGTGIARNPAGVEELTANASVNTTGWYVVVRTPTSEVFRPIAELRHMLRRNAAISLAAAVLLMLLILPRLLRPLTGTAEAIRAMASGERKLEPLPVQRNDEVGDLVQGFNHLVKNLQEKEQALMATMAQLDQQAGTDTLTGTWNRRHFHEVLPAELERASRYQHPLSLLVIDLDLFKTINDRFGHLAGDQVLREVADCIRADLRKPDSLTRWGGEEFVVLLPDTSAESAALLAERIRASLAVRRIDRIGVVTASIGVAQLAMQESWEHWLARADAALYRAKQAGRNRVMLAEGDMAAGSTTADRAVPAEGA